MGSSDLGTAYYNELKLDDFGFLPEEKAGICAYYNHYYENQNSNIRIEPLLKEDFDKLNNHMKEFQPEVCLLWTDGGSNYAGVYYKGLLRGKVMFLDHDDYCNHAPLFRSVFSFIEHVKSRKVDFLCIPSLITEECYDYPAKNLTENEKAQDLKIAKELLDQLSDMEDDQLHFNLAIKAAYLTPAEHLDLLIPLATGNSSVALEICYLFAFHNYERNLEITKGFLDSLSDLKIDDVLYSRTAQKAMHLMPIEHYHLLIPLLKSENRVASNNVTNFFVSHNFTDAIPALRDAVENGKDHVKNSAERALSILENRMPRD